LSITRLDSWEIPRATMTPVMQCTPADILQPDKRDESPSSSGECRGNRAERERRGVFGPGVLSAGDHTIMKPQLRIDAPGSLLAVLCHLRPASPARILSRSDGASAQDPHFPKLCRLRFSS
jgi:hypothetical protein